MQFVYPEGATPIDNAQLEGLIPDHITLQSELNAWEAQNITEAKKKFQLQGRKSDNILTIDFAKTLHKQMFDRTWVWAGQFRTKQTNIGTEAYKINVELVQLMDDMNYWISNRSFDFDEIGIRFHHRLVWIHLFPNGNGRFGRLYSDLLMQRNGHATFSWGRQDLTTSSDERSQYLQALYEADKNQNFVPLLKFARG